MNEIEVIRRLFDFNWPSDDELVEFAEKKTGYGGDDGYYGVLYPGDLDDYDKEVDGYHIPDGMIEVAYWNGDDDVIQVPEELYLQELLIYLKTNEKHELSSRIGKLLTG